MAVLKVLTFTKYVCCYQYTCLFRLWHISTITNRREFLRHLSGILAVTCCKVNIFSTSAFELIVQISGSIGILCKNKNLFIFMFLLQHLFQLIQLCIGSWVPWTTQLKHFNKNFAILVKTFLQWWFKESWIYPLNIVLTWNSLIIFLSLLHVEVQVSRYGQ